MEEKIMREVEKFMQNLEKISESGDAIEPERHLGACVGNIINDILFSRTFEYVSFWRFKLNIIVLFQNDPTFIRMQDILDNQSTLVLNPMMGLYLSLPFTIHIPFLNRPWKRLMHLRNDFWHFLDVQIQV
jgi:hypothetical protein